MKKSQEKAIKKLIKIGINYKDKVDIVYILKDIQRILNGEDFCVDYILKENYFN